MGVHLECQINRDQHSDHQRMELTKQTSYFLEVIGKSSRCHSHNSRTIGPATQADVTAKTQQVSQVMDLSTIAALTAALSLLAQTSAWTASTSAPSTMWRFGLRVLKEISIWRLSGLGRRSPICRSKFDRFSSFAHAL